MLRVRQGQAVTVGICPLRHPFSLCLQQSPFQTKLHQLYPGNTPCSPQPTQFMPLHCWQSTPMSDYLVSGFSVPLARLICNRWCSVFLLKPLSSLGTHNTYSEWPPPCSLWSLPSVLYACWGDDLTQFNILMTPHCISSAAADRLH